MIRRILHIDMDAFYASVEQRDHPELKGKPVIVGKAQRGVVSAASYEARSFGVRSGMPVFQARKLCPPGVFLPVRMRRYQEVSRRVMAVLSNYSPLVEPVSIDEAFLDITGTECLLGPPEILAQAIKKAIQESTGLTCSVGIAPNRFLAKIASEMNKPDGLTIIEDAQVGPLLAGLDVEKLPGVGKHMADTLKRLGVNMVGDILKRPIEFWVKRLGKSGAQIYERAQGRGSCEVVPHRAPKSFGAEDTFPSDTDDPEALRHWLLHQAESVGADLRSRGYRGRTVTLKVKYGDFRVMTRSRTFADPTCSTRSIYECAVELLTDMHLSSKVRLIGISISNLDGGLRQACCFADDSLRKQEMLDSALDKIQDRFGRRSIQRARQMGFEP